VKDYIGLHMSLFGRSCFISFNLWKKKHQL